MRPKTILLFLIIVALFAVLSIGAYFLFFGKPATTAVPTGTTGTLPAAGTQSQSHPGGAGSALAGNASTTGPANAFGVISNDPALNYFVDAQNNAIIIEPNGSIEEVSGGQITMLSSSSIQNIIGTDFSHDGKKLLVNSGDPQNPQTAVFDVATKAWTSLPQGEQSPRWSPSDYRVGYLQSNTRGVETLGTIDVSSPKNKPVALTTLDAQNLSLKWLTKNQIAVYDKPTAYAAGSMWSFNLQSGALVPIVFERPGLEALWNTTGASATSSTGLAFFSNPMEPGGQMELITTSGNVLENLTFLTLPSKCAFSAGAASASGTPAPLSLFCAIPRDQQTFSSSYLPDNYDQMAIFTSDDFYQINLASGDTNAVLADATQNFDASDVKFFNETLFFINRYDKKLYGITLGQ